MRCTCDILYLSWTLLYASFVSSNSILLLPRISMHFYVFFISMEVSRDRCVLHNSTYSRSHELRTFLVQRNFNVDKNERRRKNSTNTRYCTFAVHRRISNRIDKIVGWNIIRQRAWNTYDLWKTHLSESATNTSNANLLALTAPYCLLLYFCTYQI